MMRFLMAALVLMSALSTSFAQEATKYFVHLFDFQTNQPIGKAFETTYPHPFNVGDVYMFSATQGAPIQRVAHYFHRSGAQNFASTWLFVSRPGANFSAKVDLKGAVVPADNPVPWPWDKE